MGVSQICRQLSSPIEDRWALSDNKQTLTISSHIETDKGGANMTLVCGREQR